MRSRFLLAALAAALLLAAPAQAATPATPIGLTAAGINTAEGAPAVRLDWNASSGATLYNIYRSDKIDRWGYTPNTTFTNAARVTAGATYCYRVQAQNSDGVSAKSPQVCAVAGAGTAPAPTPPASTDECTKTLAAGGNVQSFADSLSSGQVGCLRGGTYYASSVLYFRRGGVTVQSYPGERATIDLRSYMAVIPNTANKVTLRGINFRTNDDHTLRVYGDDVLLTRSRLTNRNAPTSGACLSVGGGGGTAYRMRVVENIFHGCGSTAENQNHPIYAGKARTLTILGNLFYGTGGYAVHLYPDVAGATVTHNVIDGAGAYRGGALIDSAFNDHLFERNIIANVPNSGGILAKTSGSNRANSNCFWNNRPSNLVGSISGSGNVTADPQFVNRSVRDYRLALASPCLLVVGYDAAAKLDF